MLPQALALVEHAMAMPNLDEAKGPTPLFNALGSFVALTSLGAPAEQREEFITVAAIHLKRFPEGLLLEAVSQLIEEIRLPRDFVPAVVAKIRPAFDKLEAEKATIARLIQIWETSVEQ